MSSRGVGGQGRRIVSLWSVGVEGRVRVNASGTVVAAVVVVIVVAVAVGM